MLEKGERKTCLQIVIVGEEVQAVFEKERKWRCFETRWKIYIAILKALKEDLTKALQKRIQKEQISYHNVRHIGPTRSLIKLEKTNLSSFGL